MGVPDETTNGATGPLGCGRFARERLELLAAAIGSGDAGAPVDPLVEAHLVRCAECAEAVRAIEADNALLSEMRTSVRKAAEREAEREVARDGGERNGAGSEATGEGGPIPGYTLVGELHRGGQGAVFLAEQVATRRQCAVKMLLGGRFAGERERQRFDREVEVVARLRHPSIVTLYESGRSRRGEPWFAMELVEGERLDAFVARLALAPFDVARLVRAIAAAVAYAHRRGVIHRDLKPGNILVDRDGMPRILDFGVARSDDARIEEPDEDGTTKRGEFVGTYGYAAPEQLLGDPEQVDSRCDLYALGVILYECLAGRRPFAGVRSIGELVALKSSGSFPRPSSVAPAIPKDLEVIALRLLAADPARRYETADALVEDLDRVLDGRPIRARADSLGYVIGKTLRRHWIATAAGIAVSIALAAAGVALAVAYTNASRERMRAERTLRAFQDVLETTNPELGMGTSDMRVLEFIGLVESGLDEALASDPGQLAEVLRTIGLIHLGFGSIEEARGPIERAHALQREGFDSGRTAPERMAAAALALARLRFVRSADDPASPDFAASEAAYREALALREASLGRGHLDTIDALRQLASALRRQGKFDEARAALDRAAERLARGVTGGAPRAIALQEAAILNARAALAGDEGDLPSALEAYGKALAAVRATAVPDDFRIGMTHFNLARTRVALGARTGARAGALADALPDAREAVRILRLRKGDDAAETKRAVELLAGLERSAEGGALDWREPSTEPAPR